MSQSDTIVAIATPAGVGGVGVIRVSGLSAKHVATRLTGIDPRPRVAHYATAKTSDGQILDQGLLLYFPAPHSYTGEDVVEFQGHGSPVLLQRLVSAIVALPLEAPVRLAEAGEFTQRAFLNDKLDLAQAEAVADLIEARTEKAADAAMLSLQGVFSARVNELRDAVIALRVYVEAALDFSDEEIDFMSEGNIAEKVEQAAEQLTEVQATAHTGQMLHDGVNLAIIGAPNAGKSSLLNRLAGSERAIVTELAGTTRDTINENIQLDGFPVNVIDTAGLRDTDDKVEQIGIARTLAAIEQADLVLWLRDGTALTDSLPIEANINLAKVIEVHNKRDLQTEKCAESAVEASNVQSISALTGEGIDALVEVLKRKLIGENQTETAFSARARHLQALTAAGKHLAQASTFAGQQAMPELVAEELRYVQDALGDITGEFTSDDLLGRIFSDFCIGK